MKVRALALTVVFTLPLSAQTPDAAPRVFEAALARVGQHVHAVHQEEIAKLPTSAIAVAQRTIGGAPEGFRMFTSDHFGPAIAAELLESYGTRGPQAHLIDQATVEDYVVLPLQEFEIGAHQYDWQSLNERYPDIRYVLRVSWPIVDHPGTYAVVRYEVIGPHGPEFAAMTKFEKQNDGGWKGLLHEVGDIWK